MRKIILLLIFSGISLTVRAQEENQIGATGNVGIGTTSPSVPFQIKKTTSGWLQEIAGTSPNIGDFVGLKMLSGYAGETNKWVGITAVSESLHSNETGLGLYAGKKERLRIKHNGNVGIGIMSPSVPLHIYKNQSGWLQQIAGTSPNIGDFVGLKILSGYVGDTGKWVGLSAVSESLYSNETGLALHTGKIERLRIKNNGNVGVGTATPKEKLHLEGNLLLDSYNLGNDNGIFFRENFNSANKYNLSILNFDHSSSGISPDGLSINAYDGVSFSTGSNSRNERMRINKYGNVGIGTVDPGNWKLAVNGKIRAKEIKVETGWSDFVFYDDYKLPSLQEVETHIKEKGHLKNIPSAKEVAENGILLGEMDSKLLQKIEELTLYTISQEKKIKKQEEKISKLESLNIKLVEILSRLNKLEEK
ncbi:MAG: hypothetical protein ACSHW4_13035 [Cellulophaga sp.]